MDRPAEYPYVFVPPQRYDFIQRLRLDGRWTVQRGKCPVNNFKRQFNAILARTGIKGEFHDLRRTCLTRWLMNGLTEYDVMNLAGHADFETTRRFYLSVRQDLLQRARAVNTKLMPADFAANLLQMPSGDKNPVDNPSAKSLDCKDLGTDAPVAQQDRASVS